MCRTFKAMIQRGLLSTWTRCVATPLFPALGLSQLRLSMVSTSQAPLSGRVYANLEECVVRERLPASYTIPPHLLKVGPDSFASGGYGDVYEGTLNGSKIRIKRVRVHRQHDPKRITKVRHRCRCFPVSLR
jgi:hypothetical protein